MGRTKNHQYECRIPKSSHSDIPPYFARNQPKRFPMKTTLTTMMLITIIPLPSFSYSTFPSAACLRSCSTCKQMYGGNFKGHLCARSCLQSMGSSWRPVCTDLPSITSFLDLSSLATFRWADDEI